MAWIRNGDSSATYPAVMKTAALPAADERTVNEVMGFVLRLAFQSGAHTTDYVIDEGTAFQFGGSPARARELIAICKKVRLLTLAGRIDGVVHYKIVEDPDFIHLRLKAEIEWEARQQADGKDESLTVPVRARDGDLCRYCGRAVQWTGRPGKLFATFDHLEPSKPASIGTLVVACKSCNSGWRDVWGRYRDDLRPAPAVPFYSERTAEWLCSKGVLVTPTQRPGSQPGTAAPKSRTRTGKRTGSQPDTARTSASDPAHAGPRAQPATDPDPPPETRVLVDLSRLSQGIETGFDRDGTGRDGSEGSHPPRGASSTPKPAGTRRRSRSRRGRTGGPPS